MNRPSSLRTAAIAIAVIAAIALFAWWGSNGFPHPKWPTFGPSPSAPADTSAQDASGGEAECPAEFAQWDVTDPDTASIVKGGIDDATPAGSADKMLAAAGHDHDVLWSYATYSFGLAIPPVEELVTADGSCLTIAGQSVYWQILGAINAEGTQTKFGQADPSWVNTGMDGDVFVASTPGIYGDLKTLEFVLPNGTRVIVLTRCANPVFPTNPGLPVGRTDNPPPAQVYNPPAEESPPPSQYEAPKDVVQHPVYTGDAPATQLPPAAPVQKPATPPGGGLPEPVYTPAPAPAPAPVPNEPAPGATMPEQPRETLPPEGGGAPTSNPLEA